MSQMCDLHNVGGARVSALVSQIRRKMDFIRPQYYKSASATGRDMLSSIIPAPLLECECFQAIAHTGNDFDLGNTLKYLWRAGEKGDIEGDLNKALVYALRYHARLYGPVWRLRRALGLVKPWQDRVKITALMWDIRQRLEQ